MKSKHFSCKFTGAGIPLAAHISQCPMAPLSVDIQFQRDATKAVKRDNPAYSVDWGYLGDRIRRVLSASGLHTAEAMALRTAQLVFADIPAAAIDITIRATPDSNGDAGNAYSFQMSFRRSDVPLGPRVPFADTARSLGTRLSGLCVKALARPFHFIAPKKRWIIPPIDPAKHLPRSETKIPRILWQTNFTDRCSMPVWCNYLHNRRLSDDFEHRYISTEERAEYVAKFAPPHVASAYSRLADGAAQADLWRLVTLYREGGVYLDIDAALIRPLSTILAGRDAVYLWDRKRFSNYFMATVPGNPIFAQFIDRIVDGIEHHHERRGRSVFYVTGPGALESVLDTQNDIEYLPRKSVALTGTFTDEKYQYIDRPRSKWTRNPNFIKSPPTNTATTVP